MNHLPIIPWIGGKRRLAKVILPIFPEHRCYVEPFAGAAALFFLKSPSTVEVLNDCNGDLVVLYRVLQHHLEEFVRHFKWSLVSRRMFEWLKMMPPETLTDIQRAARFYYLQKMSFGGKVSSRTFGIAATDPPRLNLLRIEEDLSQAHLRLSRHPHPAAGRLRAARPDPGLRAIRGGGYRLDRYLRCHVVLLLSRFLNRFPPGLPISP